MPDKAAAHKCTNMQNNQLVKEIHGWMCFGLIQVALLLKHYLKLIILRQWISVVVLIWLSFSVQEYENIELCPKLMRQVELVRTANDFGFKVEAELAEDAEQEDELCLFISDVTAGGIAAGKGQSNAIVP